MSRPLWFVALIKKPFPHRTVLARLTRLPLLGRLVERLLFEGDDVLYLPGDQVVGRQPHAGGPAGSAGTAHPGQYLLAIYESVDPPQEMALPSQVVEHFIEQANDHWIMHVCICRDANQCQDYPIDLGCLFLGQAVLDINPHLGRRVTRAEALAHVRRCREAGLVHMVGRNKLDTVWLGVGPGNRLLTICNCCPCCCLWRMLPHLSSQISARVTRMPGVSVAVTDRCVACGRCTEGVCFVDAIHILDGRASIGDGCRGCGRCVAACPQQAIELTLDHEQSVRQAIDRLSPLVDLS